MEQTQLNEHNKTEYPPMHSAEHLINGTMDKMFGCGRAFSAHIEKKKSKCDYRFSRNLTEEELKQVEQVVNDQIARKMAVREEMMSVEQAREKFNLSRLPDEAPLVRIVHIGDYDSCPCIGLHVGNTSEIPAVVMVSSDCNDGVLRVRFKLSKV